MLKAHPAVLRKLLDTYESLCAQTAGPVVDLSVQRQLQDTAYTLCVTTGTRGVEEALTAARSELEGQLSPA
ncbi:DUF5133 domain-containing protein [Streptomyces albipurpureus]|uniref:DUF5133 domain-containing protein n=1 Tax=Streptomyces albipurpureus TaxID=2897419 RepID=A0ABT0UNW2_9ACTN|nr:DUF5133 domain-containing protein [Streptomyces sp. CWNU-1]MCM2389931.1 DUF5133 domain-containing protein [Streptomyces sp. CWNU-1]